MRRNGAPGRISLLTPTIPNEKPGAKRRGKSKYLLGERMRAIKSK
jgi:hypothetical protein